MNLINKLKYTLLSGLLLSSTLTFSQQKFKVTLDAGHGDHDFGAVYNGHIEKNITLALVLKVGKILEKNTSIEVNYTRKTDVFIDLVERANIANRADANIFVSIHCNANKNTVADGTETYVMGMSKNASNLEAAKRENQVITMEKDYKQKYEGYNPNKPESMFAITIEQEEFIANSIALAGKIQDRFVQDLGKKSRGGGVKQAPYMVLHKAYMPRVLIETGFISNPVEGAKLDSEEGQQDIAEAIAKAIVDYKKEFYDGEAGEITNDKPSQRIDDKPIKTTEPKKLDSVKKIEPKKVDEKPIAKGVIFKVQISASPTKLDTTPSNFKGLKNISMSHSTIYKYMYGETSSYEEAKKLLLDAKAKGYESAFIIAFKDGKSIDIKDVIK
ncbi:N-acetylmuramoyl-L-alanine amidase [Flavobacterium sp. SUN052]|uniref:N-acetylmuramoyl-L-alanine amidase family protein n=1 Tax=Flavobacterium sp. SUN052 TaxID=3002441 RepID=UPI00237E1A29|nr:N-acetylmuramoyl-L-alanine amidase [Flavobacterium sp. SUN052]MEC4005130.1 N-acetylmuramoyl-L-alanine amidase [Flavobacterium sp. SUN052]